MIREGPPGEPQRTQRTLRKPIEAEGFSLCDLCVLCGWLFGRGRLVSRRERRERRENQLKLKVLIFVIFVFFVVGYSGGSAAR